MLSLSLSYLPPQKKSLVNNTTDDKSVKQRVESPDDDDENASRWGKPFIFSLSHTHFLFRLLTCSFPTTVFFFYVDCQLLESHGWRTKTRMHNKALIYIDERNANVSRLLLLPFKQKKHDKQKRSSTAYNTTYKDEGCVVRQAVTPSKEKDSRTGTGHFATPHAFPSFIHTRQIFFPRHNYHRHIGREGNRVRVPHHQLRRVHLD